MPSLIDRLMGRQPKSADLAKDRLKLVLVNDRTDLTQINLENLKDDIIRVILKHVDIDPAAVCISVAQEGREQRLVANIPLKPATRKKRHRSRP
jgi:cell division topological specificity factor